MNECYPRLKEDKPNIIIMDTLPSELVLFVTDYLCYLDQTCMRRVNSYYRNLIPCPDFRKLLLTKLQPYSLDAEKILHELDKSKAVVAGSFILHVLYDSSWQPNDIDIFEERRVWYDYNYESLPFCSQILTFTSMEYGGYHQYEYLPSSLTRMYKSKHDKELLFNHVPIGNVGPMEFIYHSFDMEPLTVFA